MNTHLILFFIAIFYMIYTIYNNVCVVKEHLYVGQNPNINPKCDRVKSFKKQYVSNYLTSNYSDAFDCYNKCIENAECQYVGVGFDCYDNCFNSVEYPGKTLGDYRQ